MIRVTLQVLCSLLFLVASTTQANPVILDSEGIAPINFEHGTFANIQYSGLEYAAVAISAETVFISAENESQGLDLSVTFDSGLSSAVDPDLAAPFYLDRDGVAADVLPVPASFWLFGTALLGFVVLSRRTSV